MQAPLNGLPLSRANEVNEALELRKIVSIYHQVKAGTHPRLRLPGAAHSAFQTTQPSATPIKEAIALPPAASVVSQAARTSQPSRARFTTVARDSPTTDNTVNDSPLFPQPTASKAPVSGLDPIFLTKSEDLVKAELQLERQRAERVLREQLDQKRSDARHKPSHAEAKPDFDVADVLTKAWALVKPIVFDAPRVNHDNTTACDSFDENSFYSSKAPDSASRDDDDFQASAMSKYEVQPKRNDGLAADGLVDSRPGDLQRVDLTGSPYRPFAHPVVPAVPAQHPEYEVLCSRQEERVLAPIEIDEDEDEPEYSPPEPAQPFSKDNRNVGFRDDFRERGRYMSGRAGAQWSNERRYESATDADMRIVRSHITSPFAPQPSRVSPLAVAKDPPTSQNRRMRQGYPHLQRTALAETERISPDTTNPASQPRKRRKLQGGKRPARRPAIGSSRSPAIKHEPVSPPPFHSVPPLGAARHHPAIETPVYVDLEPSRDARYAPEGRMEHSPVQAAPSSASHPVQSHSLPRALSRAGPREVSRGTQDLRRVISLQNLPARDYVEPTYQTPTRVPATTSYASSNAASRTRPLDRRTQIQERPYVEPQPPLPSPAYREVEVDGGYVTQPLAPQPQRRIVVDDYGQRFYETLQPSRAPAVHAINRYQELDDYNERATFHNSAARATPVFEQPHQESRYVQEMPPPRVVYRRLSNAPKPVASEVRYITETPRAAPLDARYISGGYSEPRPPPTRSGSVQAFDYPIRQSGYVDENMPPRDTNMYVPSGRPTMRAYEETREPLSRLPSVRPEAGQVNLFPDEPVSVRREHVPVGRPVYEVRRTGEGDLYYSMGEGRRMMVDQAMPRY